MAPELPVVTTVAPDAPAPTRIRRATAADLGTINRIERTVFPQPWPYAAFERHLDEPGFLVAARAPPGGSDGPVPGASGSTAGPGPEADEAAGGGRVLGYVVADSVPNHGSPLGHVKDLAVDPDHRNRGIGSTLLERALAVLEGQTVGSVKLEVRAGNARAISLYHSFGFEHRRTIPNYYGDGEDALVMVRNG